MLGGDGKGVFLVAEGQSGLAGQEDLAPSQWPPTSTRCWFQEKTALYATVHGYFLVTFLFSAVVLGLLAWKIFTLSSATAGKEQRQHWKGVLTLLGLSSLVGMTWGLAILTPLGLSTIYIFAVFNSLQGEAPGPGRWRLPRLHPGQEVGMGGRERVVGRKQDSMRPAQVRAADGKYPTQASPQTLGAERLAGLRGAAARLRKSPPNQSRYVLHLSLWSHVHPLTFFSLHWPIPTRGPQYSHLNPGGPAKSRDDSLIRSLPVLRSIKDLMGPP